MTETLERSIKYSDEEVTRGLTQLAMCAGNSKEAARQLEAAGHHIPDRTLREWRNNGQANRYHTIRAELMPKIHARIAAECEDRAIAQAQIEAKLEEHMATQIQDLKPGETAGALRNISTSKAINIDKANVLRDKPTAIVEQRAPDQILRQLAKRYGQAVDSTAEEITDAVLVPEPQATSPQPAV